MPEISEDINQPTVNQQNTQSKQQTSQQSLSNHSAEIPHQTSSSKKTLFIAIAIIALVLAIGLIIFLRLASKPKPEQPRTEAELPKPTLVLTAPIDQEATTSAKITLKGKTNPNSLVTAYTDTQEETFESDENGDFSGTLTLDEGPNEITVTAFGDNGEEKSETRSVVYISEKEL